MDVIGGRQLSVLQIIFRQGRDAYGVSIYNALEHGGDKASLPQIYSILKKLEDRGLVESRESDPVKEKGGRRKRLYTTTGKGQLVMKQALTKSPRLSKGSKSWIPLPEGNLLKSSG